MPTTSFTLAKSQKTARTVQYGTPSSSVQLEVTQSNVKVNITSIQDDAGNTFPDNELYGDITFTYLLTSYETSSGSIDIKYAYSFDGTYSDCTRKGTEGDGTDSLTVSQGGESHTFVWDTTADIGDHFKGSVYVRIRAYDRVNQNGDYTTSNIVKIKIDNSPFAPVIVSPSSGKFAKDQTPEIIFTIADPKVGNTYVHFKVEIDTSSDFNSSNLKVWESRNSQHREYFYYDNGSGYVEIPDEGIDLASNPNLIGNNVKFIVPTEDKLNLGNYYIRVTEAEVV